jgi:hypothetical protein
MSDCCNAFVLGKQYICFCFYGTLAVSAPHGQMTMCRIPGRGKVQCAEGVANELNRRKDPNLGGTSAVTLRHPPRH